MTQAMNPYLPEYEYIPDGEPYVFGDRVYLFGSHDRAGGRVFCLNDYVCWSAPVDDLGDWRYEGVIYRRSQDPSNRLGLRLLFAPDVERGPDGRFYLYYGFDFMGMLGVAVADAPAGPTSSSRTCAGPTARPTAGATATASRSTRPCCWTTTVACGCTPASTSRCRHARPAGGS